jgi:hypothetical protein
MVAEWPASWKLAASPISVDAKSPFHEGEMAIPTRTLRSWFWNLSGDRGAVAAGGIAEAVAGKSIQSQEGTESI